MIDPKRLNQVARQVIRWEILETLYAARPDSVSEQVLCSTVAEGVIQDPTRVTKSEIGYLKDAGLVLCGDGERPMLRLSPEGVDVVEYACDCRPGIARPPKRG